MRVYPCESYADLIDWDAEGPGRSDLAPALEAEFDSMADHGSRSPREYLFDWAADEIVEAAFLVCQGKAEEGVAAFIRGIAKARDKYVDSNLDDYAEELEGRKRASRRYSDDDGCAEDYL